MPVERLQDIYDLYCADPDLLDRESQSDTMLREDRIRDSMLSQADLYLKWAKLSSVAESQAKTLKHYVEKVLWFEARSAARVKLSAAGEGKPSESRIDEVAIADPEYRRHVTVLQKAESIAGLFKRIEYAMLQRKEMLQSMNYRENTEMRTFGPSGFGGRNSEFDRMQDQVRDIIHHSRTGE